ASLASARRWGPSKHERVLSPRGIQENEPGRQRGHRMQLFRKSRTSLLVGAAVAMTALWVAPASAASALVATPDTNLVDFQTITADGSGFTPNTSVGLVQCTAGATDPTNDCDLSFLQIPGTDENGDYSVPFTVERLINTSAGQIDCAV